LEELGNGKGKLAKASEEGQGPRRAVEPMMMMTSSTQSHFNVNKGLYMKLLFSLFVNNTFLPHSKRYKQTMIMADESLMKCKEEFTSV
jgi:hypothetical protein